MELVVGVGVPPHAHHEHVRLRADFRVVQHFASFARPIVHSLQHSHGGASSEEGAHCPHLPFLLGVRERGSGAESAESARALIWRGLQLESLRPPGQDLRPGLGCRVGCLLEGGPEEQGGLRDGDQGRYKK